MNNPVEIPPLLHRFPLTEKTDNGPERFRIVSHNVFWFQGVPFSSDQPPAPDERIFKELIDLYQQIDPDMISFQEIQSADTAEALANALGFHFVYTEGRAYPQYGGAVLSRQPVEFIPLPSESPVERVIQRVRLHPEGRSPLTLSNVHLPSGRQGGPEAGRAQRLAEIPLAMGKSTNSDHFTDVIVGDFNENPNGPCADFLKKQGYDDTAQLCGAEMTSSSSLRSKRGDQIWLSKRMISRLQAYFTVHIEHMISGADGKEFISDHLPIGIDLNLRSRGD